MKILFLCHGNICRSPMAEFGMKDLRRKAGRTDVIVESAALHVGVSFRNSNAWGEGGGMAWKKVPGYLGRTLNELVSKGLVSMSNPRSRRDPTQRYNLTEKGRRG